MSRGRPQRGERVGAETIDQSPGDGEAGIAGLLRRAAGDGPAWAAHPGPDDRPRSPASSGVPVRGCAGAAGGGRGRRLSGSWNRLPAPLHVHVPVSPFCSCRCPITPANRYVPLSPLRSCHCPMTVEGAPESDCLLRCGRQRRSPRFQLWNRPPCNLPPRAISCTRVEHPKRHRRESRVVRRACAQPVKRAVTPTLRAVQAVAGVLALESLTHYNAYVHP